MVYLPHFKLKLTHCLLFAKARKLELKLMLPLSCPRCVSHHLHTAQADVALVRFILCSCTCACSSYISCSAAHVQADVALIMFTLSAVPPSGQLPRFVWYMDENLRAGSIPDSNWIEESGNLLSLWHQVAYCLLQICVCACNAQSYHASPVRLGAVHLNSVHLSPVHLSPVRLSAIHLGPRHLNSDHLGSMHLNPVRLNPMHLNLVRRSPVHLGPVRLSAVH
eukprot:1154659-Pelagomonas_calceolata.AAC.2